MSFGERMPGSKHSRRPAMAVLLLCAFIILGWWLTRDRVPDFGTPPDFAAIEDVGQMKAAFYRYLTPIVEYHNERILTQRSRLLGIRERLENDADPPGLFDRGWLEELAQQYEMEWDEESVQSLVRRLPGRVDIVPVDLALVQAAKESGWGRSRFAVEANNYFGQWCYRPGCGMVPANRAPGRTHEVEQFDSVSESIRRYMNNLNTHDRYTTLRDIRAELRASDQAIEGVALAQGLTFYSERREEYIQEVQAMIRRFHEFDSRKPDST